MLQEAGKMNFDWLHLDVIPLVFSWPYGLPFWIVYVWFFIPEMRIFRAPTGTKARSAQDAGSIKVILIGGQLGGIAGFAAAFLLPGATILQDRLLVYWIGIVLFTAAEVLRRHCFKMLGKSFTGSVIVQPDQPIVERGAYKWVRHPSYSAAFLLYIGLGLALGNWMSVVIFNAFAIIVYSYRIIVEERALVATLGEPYRDYMRRTKRIIPFVL